MRSEREHIVIIPHDEYTALEETADVLSDPDAVAALTDSLDADPADDVPLEELRRSIAGQRAVG